MMVNEENAKSFGRDRLLTITKWLVLIIDAIFILAFFAWFMVQIWSDPVWFLELAKAHYPVVIGLPFAAIGALGVVVLVEITDGVIEINALGLSMKGTAGQAVLWLACFMGMSVAMKLLW